MHFAWISEETAIISLYSINLLVFITMTEYAYCVIWTENGETSVHSSPVHHFLTDILHLLWSL
jgi:hypothetical protein